MRAIRFAITLISVGESKSLFHCAVELGGGEMEGSEASRPRRFFSCGLQVALAAEIGRKL